MYAVCKQYGLYLYIDGARLGYGLTSPACDFTMADLANLCDVFYIGGTKCGLLFGEAAVILNPAIKEDFIPLNSAVPSLPKAGCSASSLKPCSPTGCIIKSASRASTLPCRLKPRYSKKALNFW